MNHTELVALVKKMATRADRSESDLQSQVRELLTSGALNLDGNDIEIQNPKLESPVGDGSRRRIDVEAGFAIIEVKRRLTASVIREAVAQLAGYVATRAEQTGGRYVGILTDGANWQLHRLVATDLPELELVSSHQVSADEPDVDRLLLWLETVLATGQRIPATPKEVSQRLGASSPGFALDMATITDLYERVRDDGEVRLKRELWAKSLATALGTQFEDDDDLFVGHTYLVTVAELVAHASVGFDLADPSHDPIALLDGSKFREVGIRGVVEADFFDWVVDSGDEAGVAFVADLARRVARFDWAAVDHDILKALYESVIPSDTRHALGEYYTADWLADSIVQQAVDQPLTQTVLDPSCGSGTFLFHAIRHIARSASAAGWPAAKTFEHVVRHVIGVDLHPVAVTLARVTYLLAVGQDLYKERSAEGFSVPVFLGDSLQWDRTDPGTLFGAEGLRVETDDGLALFASELKFPDATLQDAANFDRLVAELTTKATNRERGSAVPKLSKQFFASVAVAEADRGTIAATFKVLCELHDHHRDHIWGYYVRNLARPLWLARSDNQVDVLVGNPPWLAYRYMSPKMQKAFKRRGDALEVRPKGQFATQADLAAFFVVTAIDTYLRPGGRFGFVMPRGALGGPHYRGFRTGAWPADSGPYATFDEPWDLAGIRPHLFPVPSSVVFGAKTKHPGPMPQTALAWTGKVPAGASIDEARTNTTLTVVEVINADDGPQSPYHPDFKPGADLYPRFLLLVTDDTAANPLGAPAGLQAVRSRRSGDKPPWKTLPDLTGNIETEFLKPCYLGESIAPYRILDHETAVVPWDGTELLDGSNPKLDTHPGLADWWHRAETCWNENSTGKMTLRQQIDHHGKLTNQYPPAPLRVVYTTSGTYLAAAVLDDPDCVIDHKLYWAPIASLDEGRYLTAVLNSDHLLELVAPLQSTGQFGTRDFHRYPLYPHIPRFDAGDARHLRLVALAIEAEKTAAAAPLGKTFTNTRQNVRSALLDSGLADRLDGEVGDLLAASAVSRPPQRPAARNSTTFSPSHTTPASGTGRTGSGPR